MLGAVLDEAGDGGDLGGPPRGVIVAGALLVLAVLAAGQPLQVFLEPLADGGLVPSVPQAGLGEEFHALNDADEDAAVDDAGAAADVLPRMAWE